MAKIILRRNKRPQEQVVTLEGNQPQDLSSRTVVFDAPSHSKGGQDIDFKGTQVEIEGGETAHIDKKGDLQIGGNLRNVFTGNLYKNDFKELGKEEGKLEKKLTKEKESLIELNPQNSFDLLAINSATIRQQSLQNRLKEIEDTKEMYSWSQESTKELANNHGVKENDLVKLALGGKIPKMENGGPVTRDFVKTTLRRSAEKYNVDPQLLLNISEAESSFRAGVAGKKTRYGTAYSHAQFLPSTAKQYGVTEEQLKSNKPEDVQAVSDAMAQHFKGLVSKAGGDIKKALIMYNGGERALRNIANFSNFEEVTGKTEETATGDDYERYLAYRRENNPSESPNAYQNQTYQYVQRITGQNDEPVPGYETEEVEVEPINPIINPPSFQPNPELIGTEDRPAGEIQERVWDKIEAIQQPTPQQVQAETQVEPLNTSVQRPLESLADRNRVRFTDILPQLSGLLDTPSYVQGQQYDPALLDPYRVSFQDRINQNQATFNQVAGLSDNPAALATLAGQMYGANQQVLAEEFRANQGIANQVANQNIQTLNQAQMQNISLADQQYVRQEQAKENTRQNQRSALQSLTDTYSRNRAQNMDIRMTENLFNYRPDQDMRMGYQGPEASIDFRSNPQTQPLTKEELDDIKQQNQIRNQQLKLEQNQQKAQQLSWRNMFGNRRR